MPTGWQEIARFLGVTWGRRGPGGPAAPAQALQTELLQTELAPAQPAHVPEHAPGQTPPCACCYYTMSSEEQAPGDPADRTCGWFWMERSHHWVWWHGDAPHQPLKKRILYEEPAPEPAEGEPVDEAPTPAVPEEHGPEEHAPAQHAATAS